MKTSKFQLGKVEKICWVISKYVEIRLIGEKDLANRIVSEKWKKYNKIIDLFMNFILHQFDIKLKIKTCSIRI